MATIRNVLNCVQPPRHTTPFFTQHGGMEHERRWDAENCRMRSGKLSYGECITELAKSHFHQWRKYFQRRQSSLGVLLFPCNPWLFSRGICSKLFSLHLTRSFELRKLYILLWIWRMRKRYQVECEHSVRFWFEYLMSGLKRYRTFEKRIPGPSWSKGGYLHCSWHKFSQNVCDPHSNPMFIYKKIWTIYQASCNSDIVRKK